MRVNCVYFAFKILCCDINLVIVKLLGISTFLSQIEIPKTVWETWESDVMIFLFAEISNLPQILFWMREALQKDMGLIVFTKSASFFLLIFEFKKLAFSEYLWLIHSSFFVKLSDQSYLRLVLIEHELFVNIVESAISDPLDFINAVVADLFIDSAVIEHNSVYNGEY